MTGRVKGEPPHLTIGLGTWNRSNSLSWVLEHVTELSTVASLEILVVDDASIDETPAVLERFFRSHPQLFRYVVHREQQGFGGSLATLIEEARGRWLFLTSDDDVVLPGAVAGLSVELERQQSQILVPGFIDGERGDIRSKPTGTIVHPGKIWGTLGHAPGIVLKTAAARDAVSQLREMLRTRNDFAIVYPQALIGLEIAASGGRITHWGQASVATGDDEPSGIRDRRGEAYWSMPSRMRQFFGYQSYLEQRITETSGPRREVFEEVLDWNRRKLLDFFSAWLTVEHPEEATAVRMARRRVLGLRKRFPTALRLLLSGRI